MTVENTEDLFVEGLQHIYYTEQRLLDALEELESTSSTEELQSGFSEHRSETEEQIERLEQVFEAVGQEPEAAEDPVIEGMIEAHEEFVEQEPSDGALDRFNIAAGQKSEHYEIACYGNLTPLADQLGLDEAADLLEQNMREEQEELDTLAEMGEEFDYGRIEA
ncbi:ferritin-like domain-containing protein [Halalkalicoccus tibetensis]|uniref:Ferritin-like domain-containing protein n=1 Tax=Halalkalicoccus tibetensis TaxID=175632 RepID=A0ABD5V292_9EURY